MSRATPILLCFALGLSGLGTTTDAWAQRFGRAEIIREASPDDLYAAGREVELLGPVNGDAVAAGGSVIIVGDVSEDVIAAGRRVTVSGAVGDDARLAGRSVTLAGSVGGHAVVAGRRVMIDEDSRIAGWANIRGTRVVIDGQIGDDLSVRGTVIQLNGQVDGNADLTARFIQIGDDAVIKGDLTWRAQRASISESAVIEGEVIEGESRRRRGRGVFRALFAVIAVIVAAGVLYSVFRPWCDQCAATLKSRPWATPVNWPGRGCGYAAGRRIVVYDRDWCTAGGCAVADLFAGAAARGPLWCHRTGETGPQPLPDRRSRQAVAGMVGDCHRIDCDWCSLRRATAGNCRGNLGHAARFRGAGIECV